MVLLGPRIAELSHVVDWGMEWNQNLSVELLASCSQLLYHAPLPQQANLVQEFAMVLLGPRVAELSHVVGWGMEWNQNLSVELLASCSQLLFTMPLYCSLPLCI